MSQGLDMTVNSLPSRTWNWLKMNESKLKEIEAGDTWDVKEVAGESEEIAGLTKGTAENQEVFSNLPEDAYDFLTVMAGIRNLRLIKQEVQSKGGGFDMCKAIKEMLRVSRQEGEQEGRLEGRQEGRLEGQDEMATLSEKLILADRISELLKASTDREYRNKLLAEFGLA